MSSTPADGTAYASLRLIEHGHKFRYGHGPKLVEAGREQTITFRKEPFPHFEVSPGGFQIPIDNVATCIPAAASLATKMRRTTSSRLKQDPPKPIKKARASDE